MECPWGTRVRPGRENLDRYRNMLNREKKCVTVEALEIRLSKFSCRTRVPRMFDRKAKVFYRQQKWRRWRFRLFCNRKSSETRFLNRVASTYGPDCIILYGNWSRRDQMKGWQLLPSVGTRKAMSSRFRDLNAAANILLACRHLNWQARKRPPATATTLQKRDGEHHYFYSDHFVSLPCSDSWSSEDKRTALGNMYQGSLHR